MNTTETKKASKPKQIMVNVSEESKATINDLKELHELSDKEIMAVILDIFASAKEEDVVSSINKLTVEKQKAKIEARLAKIQGILQKAQEEHAEVTATETVTEEVVYSADDEEA